MLDASRLNQLKKLGIGGGLVYDVPPSNGSFVLTAMAAIVPDKGFLMWDHSDEVGIDVFGDRHPFVAFSAIANVQKPGDFAVVRPQLNIFLGDFAPQMLVEIALQAHSDDGSVPHMTVWSGNSQQDFPVANGTPSSIQFLAGPAGNSGSASAAVQMAVANSVPLPKAGGSWALFEVKVSSLNPAT